MSTQFNAGFLQDHQNRMHDLNNHSTSMYQPHAWDLPNETYSPYYEPPYDKDQMNSDRMNQSYLDNVSNTETWMNQSIAPPSASTELYQGLYDVEVPPARPPTIQCDPWCSAAMNRQVHSSDMLSGDHALAKCGANLFLRTSNSGSPLLERGLHNMKTYYTSFFNPAAKDPGPTLLLSPTRAPVTGDLAGSTHPNGGSLLAVPKTSIMNDHFQGISRGSARVNNSSDEEPQSWNGVTASSYGCTCTPRDSGTFTCLDVSGLWSYGNGEQDHRLNRDSNLDRWPYGDLLPSPGFPAKDDPHHGSPLGVANPDCLNNLLHTPWNGTTMSLNSVLPVPKDDDALHGLGGPGFAPHGDKERSHTLTGGLEAQQWPHRYRVPVGCMPACRSNPRRKRRRFTNGEKAVINHKRKIGVCRDCRQAKRKCTHVPVGIEDDATKAGAGVLRTQPHGSSVFDDLRLSDIDMERRNSDLSKGGL